MALGDLPHQRQAEADAAFALGVAGQAEERLEDALAKGFGHAGAAVADAQFGGAGRGTPQPHIGLGAAVAPRVLEQVAQRTTQQPLVAGDDERVAFDLCPAAAARGLLGGERQQIDGLVLVERARRVEPAGEQDLFDERVELGDVGSDLALQRFALRPGGASSSIDSAIFSRASGERSSWLALASSD